MEKSSNLTWDDTNLTFETKNDTLNPRYSDTTPEYVDLSRDKLTYNKDPKNTSKLKDTSIQTAKNQADYDMQDLNKSDSLNIYTPKSSTLSDITLLEPITYITPQANQLVNSVFTANKLITTQFYGFTNDLSYINEDENND